MQYAEWPGAFFQSPPTQYSSLVLRDHYAGLAMQMMLSHATPCAPANALDSKIAQRAFDVADAMIEERKTRQFL